MNRKVVKRSGIVAAVAVAVLCVILSVYYDGNTESLRRQGRSMEASMTDAEFRSESGRFALRELKRQQTESADASMRWLGAAVIFPPLILLLTWGVLWIGAGSRSEVSASR